MRKNVLVPLLSAGAVGAVLVGGTWLAGGLRDGDDGPPTLAIGTGADRSAAGSEAALSSDMPMSYGGAGYVLDGTLPDGPSEAATHRFAAGDVEERKAAIAEILGIDPASPDLNVSDDAAGFWGWYDSAWAEQTYSLAGCAATSSSSVTTELAPPPEAPGAMDKDDPVAEPVPVEPCVVPPQDFPAGPDQEAALALAAPVLEALGASADDARVEVGAPTTYVTVDPVVDGLPTRGLTTSVEVAADGIVSASGVIGTPEAGDVYPLISAQAAYDQLSSMPVPEIAMLCPEPLPAPVPDPAVTTDGAGTAEPGIAPACGPLEPITITGAELGLTLHYDEVEPLLVPSWLFNAGDPYGPTWVAVDPAYLSEPAPPEPVDPDTPVEGGGSGSSPGSPGVAEPAPAPIPDGPAALVDGATVTVTWIDSSSCPRTLLVESESDAEVRLTLSTLPPDTVCTADAVPTKGAVTLGAPLGDRMLLFEGSPIPIQT